MAHIQLAKMILDGLAAAPDGPGVLLEAQQGLAEDRWGGEYTDSVGQHGLLPASSWPMEQVAAFAEVHSLIYGGSVAQVVIGTRRGPNRDADREGNAATLADLPGPFRAEIDMGQNNADADGTLIWDEPVHASLATDRVECRADGSTAPAIVRVTIPPGRAALQIGSSLPSRTLEHLIDGDGRVARWPYRHDRIRLFVNVDRSTLMSHRLEPYAREILSRVDA